MRVVISARGGYTMVITKALRSNKITLNYYAINWIVLRVELDFLMLWLGSRIIGRFL